MTGLAADVASLATGLGAVASDMARLVAIIAALHRKATGIVATLRAAARHVTSLVAIVTTQLRSLSERNIMQLPICDIIPVIEQRSQLCAQRSTAGRTLDISNINNDCRQLEIA